MTELATSAASPLNIGSATSRKQSTYELAANSIAKIDDNTNNTDNDLGQDGFEAKDIKQTVTEQEQNKEKSEDELLNMHIKPFEDHSLEQLNNGTDNFGINVDETPRPQSRDGDREPYPVPDSFRDLEMGSRERIKENEIDLLKNESSHLKSDQNEIRHLTNDLLDISDTNDFGKSRLNEEPSPLIESLRIQKSRDADTAHKQNSVAVLPSPSEGKKILRDKKARSPKKKNTSFSITPRSDRGGDGGWHRSKKVKSTDKTVLSDRGVSGQQKRERQILHQSRISKRSITPPQPYSNNYVMEHGRVPAAKQQSTLFKATKTRKPSPRVSNSHLLVRLPAIGSREMSPAPAIKRLEAMEDEPIKKSYYVVAPLIYRDKAVKPSKVVASRAKQKLSKNEQFYVRLLKMVSRVGSDLLRMIFYNYLERQHTPRKLFDFLRTNKKRLKGYASTYKLISRRWGLMYPDEDESKANLQQLDSALIFWFLRYICHLRRPNDFIWKRKPAADDLTETGDCARIRDIRNFLLNLSVPALYDDEYERKVSDLKQISLRVCGEKQGQEMIKIIDEMKEAQVKYAEREQYLAVLNHWAEETGDRIIAPAKYSGEAMKIRTEMTKRFLEKNRNPTVFVSTKGYNKAKEKLASTNCIVLKGNIGDGKTSMAVALMLSLFDEDECALVSAPEQWQFVDPRAVKAILMDDIFGSGSLDVQLLNEWETKFDQIQERITSRKDKPGIQVIITIRQHILEQCLDRLLKHSLFTKDRFIDCSSSELVYSEKRSMLARHLLADNKSLAKSEIDKSAKSHDSRLGYPQCCALYVAKEAFLIIGSQFFERPIELLFDQLNRMYDGDKYAYLGMVLLMFQKDGILYVKKLQEFTDPDFKTKTMDLAFLCQIPLSDHLHSYILQALDNQVSSFVTFYEDRKCYTFAHESIMEAMMASFGERHPQEVLEGCSFPFLMDFVGTDISYEERGDEIFIMRVKQENFLVLAKVIEHYVLGGEAKRISQHRSMKDVRFVEFFFSYIKQNNNTVEVVLSEDKHHQESKTNRRKVGFLYGAIDQEVPNVDLVTAILETGIHKEKNIKKSWCASELQSSLCMAIERGTYDIYKVLLDTGVEIPDKVLYEEKYLVSVDIVRDILTRRHWSSEQKDIAIVRAARGLKPESQEIVTLLLQEGAAANSIRVGTTALCEAVKSGKMKTVSLLLASGASVHDRDATQQTPLHHACDWNNIEVVKMLLKKHADVNARDSLGFSPFLVAAGWGRETIIELFMGSKLDVLATDDQENTVLHICAANGQARVMKIIMDAYPKEIESILIARNKHGWTPLDFALRCGHLAVTKLLIQHILNCPSLKTQQRTFVHTRFYVVKMEDFDVSEKYQYRFLNEGLNRTCFQMPRGNWFIQAGNREEYEQVRQYAMRFEGKLRQYLAKS